MFQTPPSKNNMVRTRGQAKKESVYGSEGKMNKEEEMKIKFSEPPEQAGTEVFSEIKSRKSLQSKKSSTSAMARIKKLELEAAQEKARIQTELIEKKLAADIAAIESEYSPQGSEAGTYDDNQNIESWIQRSQQELPLNDGGPDGSIQQLANAIKDLVVAAGPTGHNENLLSRISTPKELPLFFGDHLEWLHFKKAYEESTQVCHFTDTENLWRLRKCLRGAAKETVSSLLISDASPETVMSALQMVYGNPEIIITKVMNEVKKLNPLPLEYQKEIVIFSVKVKNLVASIQALKRLEYLQAINIVEILLTKLPTVLVSKWVDYSYKLIMENQKPRLVILSEFLSEEAMKISTSSASLMNIRTEKRNHRDYGVPTHNILINSDNMEINRFKCAFCHVSSHKITECQRFKKTLIKDRWRFVKRVGLCFKCLVSRHDRQTCPAAVCDVQECGRVHHRLLHIPNSRRINSVITDNNNVNIENDIGTNSEVVTHINSPSCLVLLKIVPITIHGPNGKFKVNALLDDGSTVSMISASLATRAGLHGKKHSICVRGAWNNTELICETEIVNFNVTNKYGSDFNLTARSVNELCLPKQYLKSVICGNYEYLRQIRSELSTGLLEPELLIGQDNCHLLLPLEILAGKPNEPCATRTPLGWCLHGRLPRTTAPAHNTIQSTLCVTGDATATRDDNNVLRDLHDDVHHFFSLESLGVLSSPRQNSEEQRASQHLERTCQYKDGRWEIGLPWKDANCIMPDSLPTAMTRLRGVEKKMMKNPEYGQRYQERVRHLLLNGYAEKLIKTEKTSKTWYLPHFGVDNPNKKKLRLVFDAAAKTSDLSLNDYLYKGPDLLMSLFGIMLRFRENKIAVTGDIKDMFLRVKVCQGDQNALRFLYRGNPYEMFNPEMLKDDIKTYVMTSLIFGANCSPFIAQFIKNKNAQRFESTMQTAVSAIHKQHYMDDYIDSLPDENTAIQLIKEISFIHSQGGFEICNWNSNSCEVLTCMPKETLGNSDVRFKISQQYDVERTLGLLWHTTSDTLDLDLTFKKLPEKIINGTARPTKRNMLQVVMSIFDIYGFLSPFTIIGKILLQDTWNLKIDWDDSVSDEIFSKWVKWMSLIKTVNNIRLPRYYYIAALNNKANDTRDILPSPSHSAVNAASTNATSCATSVADQISATPNVPNSHNHIIIMQNSTPGYRNLQMHIFCDSSCKAYCAVAYWRWIDNANNIRVAFIASKCRVAGNKPTTIPRLELQAAVIAARLAYTLTKEHRMKAEQRIFWCDSTTVLHWIRNDARNYEVFIANRLGEIDEHSKINEWRYIPTKLNVADYATRENYECTFPYDEWFYGPTFLTNDEEKWPCDVINPENKEQSEYVTVIKDEEIDLPVPEPERFSSWLRLLRSTSKVLIFINKLLKVIKRKNNNNITYSSEDCVMSRAEQLLLKISQAKSFKKEINLLKDNKNILTSSKLLTLSPFLDEHGVLRARGRISAVTEVSTETKFPVILDGGNYITRLIVRHYHIRAAHGNQEAVVNNLKQKYYIFRMRPTVKSVSSKCMMCRLRKIKPEAPKMGDLPEARMAHHHRPFTFCGVDLFGPMEITSGRRREKRYGVLFTCLTVRAIHLEVVASLTTDSFLMALRRMAARRGWPQQMFSDNGTNLRGADKELKNALRDLDEQALTDEAINHGTKWTFIPPASPHWGGAWERLIRSVKTSLRIVLRERAPREEVLLTLMAEVEAIVNSRPLTHVSVEPGSDEALTPAHFLLGTSSMLPAMGKFTESDLYLRRQWRISQQLADMFWRRWMREVLPAMIPRRKWPLNVKPLQKGDLVVIVDPSAPRYTWPKGRIEEVCPGKDGQVRKVRIRTANGILTRSAVRVAQIPMASECC